MNKVIVFDVGRVLVDFSFDPFENFLKNNGAQVTSRDDFYRATKLFEYERGELKSKDFVSSVQSLLSQEVAERDIVSEWVSIFSPVPEMITFALDIRAHAKTLILSNTNQLHWEYLDDSFSIRSVTEKAFTSYEVGAMKPHAKIYDTLQTYAAVEPAHIFFIDDLAENISAAYDRGWKGIVHVDIDTTKEAVYDFLK